MIVSPTPGQPPKPRAKPDALSSCRPGRAAGMVQWQHHVRWDMVGMLACAKVAIVDQERTDMLSFARRMKMDDLAPVVLSF